jgi:hypothetical protein
VGPIPGESPTSAAQPWRTLQECQRSQYRYLIREKLEHLDRRRGKLRNLAVW